MSRMFSPVDQAKFDVVHDFPGGAATLAPLVGMNHHTLCNKVNPNMSSHGLMVDEALVIQHATSDYRLLLAEAAVLGHICVDVGEYTLVSDKALLDIYTKFHAQVGQAASQLNQTLSDGRIERRECEEFRSEMFTVFQAGMELCHRLEGLIDE